MESRLGSRREWRVDIWRGRFFDHPIGGFFGRRLIWLVASPSHGREALLPTVDGWLSSDGRSRSAADGSVSLWHPAEASSDEVATWQQLLSSMSIEQPIAQVERETFRPLARDNGLAADRRFAGTVVDHRQLRTLLRQRGWAAPFVGTWDQGDEATAWRAFEEGLRAELRYQALEPLRTGERHERVRMIAIRFIQTPVAPIAAATEFTSVELRAVPPRVFSEAVRDVSQVIVSPQVQG